MLFVLISGLVSALLITITDFSLESIIIISVLFGISAKQTDHFDKLTELLEKDK
jgi:hypothetical protein